MVSKSEIFYKTGGQPWLKRPASFGILLIDRSRRDGFMPFQRILSQSEQKKNKLSKWELELLILFSVPITP